MTHTHTHKYKSNYKWIEENGTCIEEWVYKKLSFALFATKITKGKKYHAILRNHLVFETNSNVLHDASNQHLFVRHKQHTKYYPKRKYSFYKRSGKKSKSHSQCTEYIERCRIRESTLTSNDNMLATRNNAKYVRKKTSGLFSIWISNRVMFYYPI